jgi:hypothetical protein
MPPCDPRNLTLSLHDLPPAYEFGQPNFARVFYGALFILVAALAALFFLPFFEFCGEFPPTRLCGPDCARSAILDYERSARADRLIRSGHRGDDAIVGLPLLPRDAAEHITAPCVIKLDVRILGQLPFNTRAAICPITARTDGSPDELGPHDRRIRIVEIGLDIGYPARVNISCNDDRIRRSAFIQEIQETIEPRRICDPFVHADTLGRPRR